MCYSRALYRGHFWEAREQHWGSVRPDSGEVSCKAETFSHYTYCKSGKQLMVVDIQGVNYTLFDPEIATSELLDNADQSILFCCGNLSSQAIEKFKTEHWYMQQVLWSTWTRQIVKQYLTEVLIMLLRTVFLSYKYFLMCLVSELCMQRKYFFSHISYFSEKTIILSIWCWVIVFLLRFKLLRIQVLLGVYTGWNFFDVPTS